MAGWARDEIAREYTNQYSDGGIQNGKRRSKVYVKEKHTQDLESIDLTFKSAQELVQYRLKSRIRIALTKFPD